MVLTRPLVTAVSALALLTPLAIAVPALAQDSANDDLELRRVMLSTGGVGYFEYEATVTGAADLTLDIRLDQVDDVLKSIVVFDEGGDIGQISLPGQTPLREVFRDLPFTPADLESPASLLAALRGTEIRAEGPRAIEGRVLSVNAETRGLEGGGTESVNRVTLMTDDGLAQLILEESDRLTFLDDTVRDQVSEALTAVSGNSAEDQRQLSIDVDGEGTRTVRVAYLVEIPLWKTAYRLTFNEAGDGVASLQGWAVIENLSGEDWQGVDLAVASGNPVTFRQALYDAYFVDRPEVPVEVLGRILPPVDPGTIAAPLVAAEAAERGGFSAPAGIAAGAASVADLARPEPAPAPPGQAQLTAASSTEAATQVLFRFPQPVTVESGHSLLLPIVSRETAVDRPLLYQPSVHPRHPMATAELQNDGDSGLPPGILTIYERDLDSGLVSYLGDARVDTLPVGDERLVSYALDQTVTVDRETLGGEQLTRVAIVDGVLRRTIVEQRGMVYTVEGAANRDNQVILEHPRPSRPFEMVRGGGEDLEMTADTLRIPVEVPAGETVVHEVMFERTLVDTIDISALNRDRIVLFAQSRQLPDDVRAALTDVAERVSEVEDLERSAREIEAEIGALINDQGRIRANLDSLPTDSDLYQRYLATLSQQEDRLETLRSDLDAQAQEARAARAELADFVRALTVGN